MQKEYSTLDEALVDVLKTVDKVGKKRKPEWQRCECVEFPKPVTITLKNPLARFVTLKSRKFNAALAVAESLWILSGMNDLNALPGHFAKRIYDYADDGYTYRAGYGPRIRFMNGEKKQYKIGLKEREVLLKRGAGYTDQLKYCILQLTKDKFTRQATITIHDPVKDDYDLNGNLLKTKDTPCTRTLQFLAEDDKLNMVVHMRSNDILHGFSAINVPEFTFMQQIVAKVCGFKLGKYYHVANNLHYYVDMEKMVKAVKKEKPEQLIEMETFTYDETPISLTDVDRCFDILFQWEQGLEKKMLLHAQNPFYTDKRLQVFSDYAEVLRLAQCKKHGEPAEKGEFYHPQLQVMYANGAL